LAARYGGVRTEGRTSPSQPSLLPFVLSAFRYGGFRTIRALETPGGDDDRQWLTYWLIFFLLTTAEYGARVLLSWAPHYYEVKLLFLLWLMFAGVSVKRVCIETEVWKGRKRCECRRGQATRPRCTFSLQTTNLVEVRQGEPG
jgi:hypothetical protein